MAKKRTQDRHAPHRTLRIPEELYLELEAMAAETDRPVHWEARRALRKHIAEHKARKGKPPADASDDN